MSHRKLFSVLFIVTIILGSLVSCNEIDPKGEKEVGAFLTEWNDRHTPIKAAHLKHEYMDVVTYYGAEMTKEQVQRHKRTLFETFPDYSQQIENSTILIEREGADYIISFDRSVSYDGKTVNVPSFLNVSAKNSEFRILTEGLQQVVPNAEIEVLFPSKSTLEANFGERRKLYGDFNGDALSDFAWIPAPASATNCTEGCDRTVQFSNPDLRPWMVEGVHAISLENLTDLNRDGADEVGLWSKKPNAHTLYIWDASNNQLLTEPLVINTKEHKNLKLIDVIKKSGRNKVTVTESVQVDGVWKLVSRVVVLE